MTFSAFVEQVRDAIRGWLDDEGIEFDQIPLEEPSLEKFGDLSTSIAFMLASRVSRAPASIARELADAIIPDSLIAKIEFAEPGYVNFWVDDAALARQTVRDCLEEGRDYGRLSVGAGETVQVEHTSVNPNKALHIGHARNVVLGDSLAALLRFAGYEVEIVNYIDDTGVQVAEILMGFRYFAFPEEPEDVRFDQYCGDEVYVKVHERVDGSDTLRNLRSRLSRRIDEGEGEIADWARAITSRILRAQLTTAWRLGASYDALIRESDVLREGMWSTAFEKAKKTGMVEYIEEGHHAGCWVAKLTQMREFVHETDKVLVKSDGTTTYVAKDLAFAMWKLGLLDSPLRFERYVTQPDGDVIWSTSEGGRNKPFGSVDRAVTVIDVRQSRNQEVIHVLLSSLYGEDVANRYLHYAYEVVSLSGATMRDHLGIDTKSRYEHMSGRKGLYINVDPFMDLLRQAALEESRDRNPDAEKEWLDETSEKVALASLRYALLTTDTNKIVVFDVDRALDVTEESGSYVLYGYARASGILERAEESPAVDDFDSSLVATPEESRLVKAISKLPMIIERSARDLDSAPLGRYAFTLTTIFNKFYEKCPVTTAENPELLISRLTLVASYAQTMRNVCGVLGLPLVARM